MWNKYFVFLGGFLLLIGVQNSTCFGSSNDPHFPLGTIGCLFVDEELLCGENAVCIDDFLFGTCPGEGVPNSFAYTLTEEDEGKLILELVKLRNGRLTWLDGFTQCIVQNVILSLSLKEPFNKKICYNLLFDLPSETETEIESVLGNLLSRDFPNSDLTFQQQNVIPVRSRSQKRDEVIRVHKYFDKSKAIHKRLLEPTSYDPSYLSYYPKDDLVDLGINEPDLDLYPSQNNRGWEDSGIPLSDFQMVKNYLEATKDQSFANSYNEEVEGPQERFVGDFHEDEVEDDIDPGYQWIGSEDLSGLTPPASVEQDEQVDSGSEEDGLLEDALPPYYANLLDKLIRGEIEPEKLTDDDLGFLLPYVTNILGKLSDLDLADNVDQEAPLKAAAADAMESEMMLDQNSIPYGTDEEDMNMDSNELVEEDVPVLEEINTKQDNDAIIDEDQNPVLVKKTDELSGIHEAVKKDDIVNTNVVYVKMDHILTETDADKIMEVLQKNLDANPGALNNYLIEGDTLKINVDSILSGVDAQQVAKQADFNRVDIEKVTGYKFLGTGIGDENTIEYKGADDRYFVLTFVLCGCIAGILLAVVVIYLIKRNTRSKEKLQQIATVQEGNDAASKDYQDLCRQRMQSKSSEKPEPLHAASRVGSVSESQVRSPSSRSSTSSWSEEPVNSNMDISTGHIVLSYMEDHLKNKDRLDREWEGMCAYEADPCSTKVAEDQTNMRKNRYADVLPYDHSRVVLTTNTNVSGSDFINASTITDHDPRNPAYVATQGPLPHTVADFWQMVWEQGSVVIVMLSKLTENGEANCHRYWPEEGSDLYHIYEVHLVSEHIWCDDYLVRSFYLKNLQTSETRTVTQFHFLTWPDLGIPGSVKALLDFRRKVNKSYRGRSCPIVVHCSDGCGRTGTYCLIDMVLNRMAKGAKEIDIAATLEHIRDQRMNIVKTKEQFQFALAAVAEEVHAILKALPQ